MKTFLKRASFSLVVVIIFFGLVNAFVFFVSIRNYQHYRCLEADWYRLSKLKKNVDESYKIGDFAFLPVWKDKDAYFHLKVNDKGYRGRALEMVKKEKTIRIICLGDSVTFGAEVDDEKTYPFQLEKLLNQRLGQYGYQVEVLNGGVPGYTIHQGLIYFSTELINYKPDIVILEFGINETAPNFDAFFLTHPELMKGDIDRGWKPIYRSPLNGFVVLFRRQPLMQWLRWRLGILAPKVISKMARSEKIPGPKDFDRFKYVQVPPEDFIADLNQFYELSRRVGFHLIIYIPCGISPAYRQLCLNFAQEHRLVVVDFFQRLTNPPPLEELLANPEYEKELQFYIDKLGIETLKKLPILVLTADSGHPNALGNRIISEEIAGLILRYYSFLFLK